MKNIFIKLGMLMAIIGNSYSDNFFKGIEEYDFQKRVEYYTKQIEQNDNMIESYYQRANAKANLKDNEGAKSDYKKASELEAKTSNDYLWKSRAYEGLEDSAKQMECLIKAIELDGKNYRAYCLLSDIYIINKDYKKAEEIATKAININPKYGYAYMTRATARGELKDIKGAKKDLKKVIKLDPDLRDTAKQVLWVLKIEDDDNEVDEEFNKWAFEMSEKNKKAVEEKFAKKEAEEKANKDAK